MKVTWSRWPEVDQLFARALECPPDARACFLADACGDDLELFQTVSELVTSSEQAEFGVPGPTDVFLRLAFDLPADDPSRAGLAPGDLVGNYRLFRELGRGGMATVCEAERADGVYEGRVALKVLRRSNTGEAAHRFHVETRALSTLAHPNVARLFDAGTTSDGNPFLVMELVEGEPITAWADHRRLPIDARQDLFLQVADAVSFAHQHLIVHRDIKPSNVLVGADGQVKLLDFGIAKLLEADPGADLETRPTARWLTPGNASPEQVLGQPVTTSTDVHGLGILLYELLAGSRPFGATGSGGLPWNEPSANRFPSRRRRRRLAPAHSGGVVVLIRSVLLNQPAEVAQSDGNAAVSLPRAAYRVVTAQLGRSPDTPVRWRGYRRDAQ